MYGYFSILSSFTGNGASSDDDDFEPPPEEEIEKIEENDDQIDVDDDEVDSEDLDDDDDEDDPRNRYSYDNLPPKKRGRPHKKLLTDAEIEEATKAAKGSKPAIEIIPLPKENGESKTADEGSTDKAEGEADGKETSDSAQEKGESADSGEAGTDAAADNPEAEKEKGEAGTEGDTAAEGQVPGEGDAELPDSKNNETESAKTSAQESDSFKVKQRFFLRNISCANLHCSLNQILYFYRQRSRRFSVSFSEKVHRSRCNISFCILHGFQIGLIYIFVHR